MLRESILTRLRELQLGVPTVVNCFNYGRVSGMGEVSGAAIAGGSGVAKNLIANFANVYYLKTSGKSLFYSGAANGADGWGFEDDTVLTGRVQDEIIEKREAEFKDGDVLTLLNNFNDRTSAAYSEYEANAWKQGAKYPILAEINVPILNKSSLEAAIAEAEDLIHGAYTAASLAALTSALSTAQDVSESESLSLTQAEADEATRALRAAITALKPEATVKIRSAAELAAFAARVNAGEHSLRARLAADITVTDFEDETTLASLKTGRGGADEWEQGDVHPVLKDLGAGAVNDVDEDDGNTDGDGDIDDDAEPPATLEIDTGGGCDAGFATFAPVLLAGCAAFAVSRKRTR
jgi:hypothetical protein